MTAIKNPGSGKIENEQIIQCNGECLCLGFLDFTNFLRTLLGCGLCSAIVPMNVFIFLPPACGGIDAMAKIVLQGMGNVNAMKRDERNAHLSVLVSRDV